MAKYTEEEYREAARIWRDKNPKKEKISRNEVIEISNGKIVPLGIRIMNMRSNLEKLDNNQKEFWKDYGIFDEKKVTYTEEEYREAAIIWKSKNPKKEKITQNTVIEISNGKIIPIGNRIYYMCSHLESLDDNQKEFWKDYGIFDEKKSYTEEEYREAAIIWKSKNPKKEKIPQNAVIEISSGRIIPIGNKMKVMRANLESLDKEKQEFWKDYGLIYNRKVRNLWTEEEYREAARIWKSKNPNATRISVNVVEKISNGKEVLLGNRMHKMRSNLEKLTEEQKDFWKDYGLFDEKMISYTEEEYREAAIIWKSKNPSIKKIPQGAVEIISSGKEVLLGNRMDKMRRNLVKLDEEQKEFWKDYGLFYKKESKTDIVASKINSLEKYIEMFDGDNEKAIRVEKCLKDLREKRRVKKKQEWNIDNILKEFDVDLETLEKYLTRTRTEEVKPRAKVLEYKGKTLRSFCIENGYNYDVVACAIKLHDMCVHDTLEQLINRSITMYNRKGQKEPATWIYEKYGNLVKHVLLHLKLDSTSILRDMTNYIMTLEEAVRHDVFKRNIDNKENAWLEELYNYLIEEINDNKEQKQTEEDIADMFVILVQEYKLTKEEYQVLWKTFSKYVDTMREYQRVDVGLETNQSKKLEKIRQYNLDEYDIEESFFVPLEFDKGVLLGRQSELYKRRQLLKQYIIDWDYFTDIEKEAIKEQNNFTDEELIYIKNTREEINEVIEESNKHM